MDPAMPTSQGRHDDERPGGLSKEEAGLYMDGLTQTCAALRRRIAELESDNSLMRMSYKASSAISADDPGYCAVPNTAMAHGPLVPSTLPASSTARHRKQSWTRNSTSARGERFGTDGADRGHGTNRSSVLPTVRGETPWSDLRGKLECANDDGTEGDDDDDDDDDDENNLDHELLGSGRLRAAAMAHRVQSGAHDNKQKRQQRPKNGSGPISRRGGSVLPCSGSLESDSSVSLFSPSAVGSVVMERDVVAGSRGGNGGRGSDSFGDMESGEMGSENVGNWVASGAETRRGSLLSPKGGSSRCSFSTRFDDPGLTRRLSAVPNRTRYSVGVSRYSLPPNMPPNASPTKSEQGDVAKSEFLWQHRVGDVWEGLKLKFPLTRDEKKLTFMEFAVVSVGETILSGARPLRNWGQDAEVISRFPRSCRDADGGGGDANGGGNGGEEDGFVEGLADFCFPSGAQMYLVEGGIGVFDAVPEDRSHLVQFTDCENASTYGCCLTVTYVLQDPSSRLIERLQDRERTHAAARTVQRFIRRACVSNKSQRKQQEPPTTPAAVSHRDSDSAPTSISHMINRFFSSNTAAPDVVGASASNIEVEDSEYPGGGDGSVGASTMTPTTANAATIHPADSGANATTPLSETSTSSPRRKVHSDDYSSPISPTITQRRRLRQEQQRGSLSTVGSIIDPTEFLFPPPKPRPPSGVSPRDRRGNGVGKAVPRVGPKPFESSDDSRVGGGWDKVLIGDDGDDDDRGRGTVSGMFSDDESESDAGNSTDRDSLGKLVGHVGPNETNRSALAVGRDDPAREQKVSLDVRDGGEVSPKFLQSTASEVRLTPPRGSRISTSGGEREGKGGCHVLVERCYAMVSCHRNHPLMFKVLKAVADADGRTHGPTPTTPTSTPPHRHRSTTPPYRGEGSTGAISPDPTYSTPSKGRSGEGSPIRKDGRERGNSQSPPSRFRTVAVAAAEEAKKKHRRMVRDKFLDQVRTDKAGTEEGKKVSVHCPAFLRTPLEVTVVPLEQWTTALLFASLSERTILRALDVLLLEKTLVVCGRDLDMVSMTATALLWLLEPFKWEGVFVPVVPEKLMDVLGSPVPALVGVQAPFDPLRQNALDGVVVLDLDATKSSHQLFMGGVEEAVPVSEPVVRALEEANTLRGRGRGPSFAVGRSPNKDIRKYSSSSPKGSLKNFGGGVSTGGSRGGISPCLRSPFAFQASTFMSGMTSEEKATVLRLRSIVEGHVCGLCGDLQTAGMWRKYGAFNPVTEEFEFYPHWFTGPLEARLKFQKGVARTQMFVSFVDRCRTSDTQALALGENIT